MKKLAFILIAMMLLTTSCGKLFSGDGGELVGVKIASFNMGLLCFVRMYSGKIASGTQIGRAHV